MLAFCCVRFSFSLLIQETDWLATVSQAVLKMCRQACDSWFYSVLRNSFTQNRQMPYHV